MKKQISFVSLLVSLLSASALTAKGGFWAGHPHPWFMPAIAVIFGVSALVWVGLSFRFVLGACGRTPGARGAIAGAMAGGYTLLFSLLSVLWGIGGWTIAGAWLSLFVSFALLNFLTALHLQLPESQFALFLGFVLSGALAEIALGALLGWIAARACACLTR